MAVVKVFSSKGVKTVVMQGNVSEQDYDPILDDVVPAEPVEAPEEISEE